MEETWIYWGILEMVWKTGLGNNKATLLGNKVVFMAPTFTDLVKLKRGRGGEAALPPFYGPIHVTEPE